MMSVFKQEKSGFSTRLFPAYIAMSLHPYNRQGRLHMELATIISMRKITPHSENDQIFQKNFILNR